MVRVRLVRITPYLCHLARKLVHNFPSMLNNVRLTAARWEWRSAWTPAPRPKTALKVCWARAQSRLGVAAAALIGPFAASPRAAGRLGAAFDIGWVVRTEAGVRGAAAAGARSRRNADPRCAADVTWTVGRSVGREAQKSKGGDGKQELHFGRSRIDYPLLGCLVENGM